MALDMYTDGQTIAWVYDTDDAFQGAEMNRAMLTGKPIELASSLGRHEATGCGCRYFIERFLEWPGLDRLSTVEGSRVVVMRFGNVGAVAASNLAESGATIGVTTPSKHLP